ncbi:hypothetical protein sos41_18030 [Alphaproteobacteria bacterium SO-S41]|nr:hypothetical protein sos41_18030 [Alphaproteobacteria bacterium SO-S41]
MSDVGNRIPFADALYEAAVVAWRVAFLAGPVICCAAIPVATLLGGLVAGRLSGVWGLTPLFAIPIGIVASFTIGIAVAALVEHYARGSAWVYAGAAAVIPVIWSVFEPRPFGSALALVIAFHMVGYALAFCLMIRLRRPAPVDASAA